MSVSIVVLFSFEWSRACRFIFWLCYFKRAGQQASGTSGVTIYQALGLLLLLQACDPCLFRIDYEADHIKRACLPMLIDLSALLNACSSSVRVISGCTSEPVWWLSWGMPHMFNGCWFRTIFLNVFLSMHLLFILYAMALMYLFYFGMYINDTGMLRKICIGSGFITRNFACHVHRMPSHLEGSWLYLGIS